MADEDRKGDRAVICEIISEMLDNPDEHGTYPTTRAFDKLEEYIKFIRTVEVPEILNKTRKAFGIEEGK